MKAGERGKAMPYNGGEDYASKYYKNTVILTDFNCSIANGQLEMRLQNLFRYARENAGAKNTLPKEVSFTKWSKDAHYSSPPTVMSAHNIPFGNIDYAAYALYSLYKALGRSTRPNILVHVTDPGVGTLHGSDRTLMVTDEDNVFIGPNNGTLGLIGSYFESRNIPFKLLTLDHALIEKLEASRMDYTNYTIPETFHGRDLFAVAAGLIAGGVQPEALCKKEPVKVVQRPFAKHIRQLPLKRGQSVTFQAFRDNTFGNLKTNLSAKPKHIKELLQEGALYKVSCVGNGGFFHRLLAQSITFPLTQVFSELKPGSPLMYLGSTFAINWDERLIELAINMGSVGDRLDVPHGEAETFTIERIA